MFQSQCVTIPLNPTLSLGVEHDGVVHCVKGRPSGKGIPWTEYTVEIEYHVPSTCWEQNTMDRVHGGNKIPWTAYTVGTKYHGPRTLWEQNTTDRLHYGNKIPWTAYTVGTKYHGPSRSGNIISWTEYTVGTEYHGPSILWERNTVDRVHC